MSCILLSKPWQICIEVVFEMDADNPIYNLKCVWFEMAVQEMALKVNCVH